MMNRREVLATGLGVALAPLAFGGETKKDKHTIYILHHRKKCVEKIENSSVEQFNYFIEKFSLTHKKFTTNTIDQYWFDRDDDEVLIGLIKENNKQYKYLTIKNCDEQMLTTVKVDCIDDAIKLSKQMSNTDYESKSSEYFLKRNGRSYARLYDDKGRNTLYYLELHNNDAQKDALIMMELENGVAIIPRNNIKKLVSATI